MTFTTYILRCSDGSYYAGHTDNFDARMNSIMWRQKAMSPHDARSALSGVASLKLALKLLHSS